MYVLVWLLCTTVIFVFMASPYWLHGWEVIDEIYVGSPIVGLLCASIVMLLKELSL